MSALNGVHGGLGEEDDAGNTNFPGHLVFNNRVDDRGSSAQENRTLPNNTLPFLSKNM
jgi:hypothetical protein